MTTDIRLTETEITVEGDERVNLQASMSVVVDSPDVDFRVGGSLRTALGAHGDELVVNEGGDFPNGVRMEGGRYRFEVPAGIPLPSMDITDATMSHPPFDHVSNVDLIQEIIRLRSEIFTLKMIVRHLVMPKLPGANISP